MITVVSITSGTVYDQNPILTGKNGRNERAPKMMKTRCYRGDKNGNRRHFYEARPLGPGRAGTIRVNVVGVRVTVILPDGMKPEGFRMET